MPRFGGVVRWAVVLGSLLTPDWLGAAEATVAFENVTVIPMDSLRVLERYTVIVYDGRISKMGPAARVKVPSDALRVWGVGRYLVPGFGEMHGHLPDADTPQETAEAILFLWLANGVTTVRGMQGGLHNLKMRDQIDAGNLLGPTPYVAGPAFSGRSATSVEIAEKMVREQKAAGYDLLKIQEGLSREVYDAIVVAANEARIRFAGHVPNEVGLHRALEVRQSSIDHLDNYLEALEADNSPLRNADPQTRARQLVFHLDETKLPALAEATRQAGVWVVPTMALWETFFSEQSGEELRRARPEVKYVPRQWVEQWVERKNDMRKSGPDGAAGQRVIELRRKILKALHEAGVKIIFGTDAPQMFSVPGFSIHREMRIMLEAGLTPFEVLQSGTRNVAEYFGALDEFGTVELGKRADLILLEANPLRDLSNMARRAGVMVRGRWLPEKEIQKRLASIAAAGSD